MIHSNTAELYQLYSTFNRVWGAGGNAVLNLKTEDGKVTATLELQLGQPENLADKFPQNYRFHPIRSNFSPDPIQFWFTLEAEEDSLSPVLCSS